MRLIKDPKKPNVTKAYPAYSEAGYRLPGQFQIRVDPETGEQIPILLPEATVYDDNAPLAGLEEVVKGGALGQLAKQYRTPQSMYDQARMISMLGQEMTGVPGTMRTINRALGEGTVGGNPLFTPPKNASTLDKVLDATDIIAAALPVVGAGAMYGLKKASPIVQQGVKRGVSAAKQKGIQVLKDKVLTPESLRSIDQKLQSDPSKGFTGGLISPANLPSDFSYKMSSAQRLARDLEEEALTKKYDELIAKAKTMGEKDLLTEQRDVAVAEVSKKHKRIIAEGVDTLDKLAKGSPLDPEETDMIYNHLSDILNEKIPQIQKPSDVFSDWTLRSYGMSAANRGVQAMADKPVVGDALKLLARKFMEKSGGAAEINVDDVSDFAAKPMDLIKSKPAYNGTVFKKDYLPDKGPNVIKAYINGDFTNFTQNISKEADEFVRTAFKQQFDTYGNMNVVDLPMIIGGSKEKPLKIVEGKYGGLEHSHSSNINSAKENLSGIYSSKDKVDNAVTGESFDSSTRVSRILDNVVDKVAGKEGSSAYNVVVNKEGIPQSFQINAEDNNPFFPLIDVAGHQMKFELVSDDGFDALYKVTSGDVWKFTPDQYASKWGTGKSDAVKLKQAAMLDAVGKPFVSVSENYVEIPTSALAKKNLTPGTY